MAAVLNVWIAKPGDPCYVDDHEWLVNIYDGHGNIYHHGTTVYANLPASQGRWAGIIPPGCYVVQATGKDANGKDLQTDHAIVEVHCAGEVCVRLYVSGGAKPGGCEITITDVEGIGSPDPSFIQVRGTADNCNEVEVSVSCHDGATAKLIVPVTANGQWLSKLSVRDLKCRCGKGVVVHAWCTADPKCATTFKGSLKCTKDAPE